MADFVTAMTTALTPANLWGALEPVAPLVGVAVIFSLGLGFVRKAVKGVGKGKARI